MTNEEYAAHAAARLPFAIRPASDYRVGDRVRFLWAFAEDGESRAHEGLIASVSEEGEGPCKGVSPTVTVDCGGDVYVGVAIGDVVAKVGFAGDSCVEGPLG